MLAEPDVVGKVQALGPVDDLAICIAAVLCAKRCPSYEAFVPRTPGFSYVRSESAISQVLERLHDSPECPPVDVKRVAVSSENLGSDVVGCPHRRVGHQAPRAPPLVDLRPVTDRQADLVDVDGFSIPRAGQMRGGSVPEDSCVVGRALG